MCVGEREVAMATDWGPGRSQRTRLGRSQEQRHEELGGRAGELRRRVLERVLAATLTRKIKCAPARALQFCQTFISFA
jgi:hypothetical protein